MKIESLREVKNNFSEVIEPPVAATHGSRRQIRCPPGLRYPTVDRSHLRMKLLEKNERLTRLKRA